MRKWLLAIVLALLPTFANATCSGVFKPGTICGNNSGVPSVPFEIPSSTNLFGPGTSTVGDFVVWTNSLGTGLGDKAPSAFSTANDSNVTITLTGSPATALFNPVTATMGWLGQLPVARGGTGISTGISGGIPYFSSTSTIAASGLLNSLILGNGAGAAPTNYAGTSCTAQFIRAFSAVGIATCASVNLTSDVINVLPVANGGTGSGTAAGAAINLFPSPAHNGDIIYWNGTNWVTLPGNTTGSQLLQEDTSGNPSWVTITGTGTVTSIAVGGGLVTSAGANCTQTPITSTGTIYASECINAQVGTTYTIVDGDRGKLITATNAAAQAYTLPQAAASSQFMSGWFAEVKNASTAPAALVTITTTTSTLCGSGQTLVLYPGEVAKIISDGTNYKCSYVVATNGPWHLLNVLTASGSANLQDTTSITSAFTEYELVFYEMIPATNLVQGQLQAQISGTFQTTGYSTVILAGASGGSVGAAAISTAIPIGSNGVNNTNVGVSGRYLLSQPASSSVCKFVYGDFLGIISSQVITGTTGGCWSNGVSTAAITGLQFNFSSGNITSGVWKIYGRVN